MSDEPHKSDIDFDELDKAVHSLMGKVGNETLEDDEKTKTLDINATLKADEKPSYDALGKAAQSIGDEALVTDSEVELVEDLTKLPEKMELPVAAPAAVPSPATKRPTTGRFMDMVHPNADMRSSAPLPNLAVPSRPVSPAASSVTVPVPAEKLSSPELPAPETPLTPFLPDAKVEKRPLGSASPTGDALLSGGNEKTAEDSLEEADDKAVKTATVNGEHDETHEDDSGDKQRALNASELQKGVPPEESLTKIEGMETDAAVAIQKVESGDTEKLKNPDKPEEGAIYDTKEYHQPIAHPSKQKSGWGTVLVIILIIVLAVALGGGLYLYFGMHV